MVKGCWFLILWNLLRMVQVKINREKLKIAAWNDVEVVYYYILIYWKCTYNIKIWIALD